jgi:hypothetical protein
LDRGSAPTVAPDSIVYPKASSADKRSPVALLRRPIWGSRIGAVQHGIASAVMVLPRFPGRGPLVWPLFHPIGVPPSPRMYTSTHFGADRSSTGQLHPPVAHPDAVGQRGQPPSPIRALRGAARLSVEIPSMTANGPDLDESTHVHTSPGVPLPHRRIPEVRICIVAYEGGEASSPFYIHAKGRVVVTSVADCKRGMWMGYPSLRSTMASDGRRGASAALDRTISGRIPQMRGRPFPYPAPLTGAAMEGGSVA